MHFEVSSKTPDVQAFIDQGVGQLHGYWYYEAERSFRQAAALDPDCAIAYWGMAMANVNNVDRAKKFMAKATEKVGKASPREKRYIDAWKAYYDKAESKPPEKKEEGEKEEEKSKEADKGRPAERDNANVTRRKALVKALEGIVYDYPDDLEAKALLVSQLYENNGKGVPLVSFLAMDALIKDVLSVNPEHPVHHYRIHIWDIEKAKLGLAAAAACGPAAPGIAHMWHMPGHIYSKLKRYDDAAWQQEASARVDHAYMMRDRILPDQIHNYAHNNEWLIRDLTFVGRAYDAIEMAKALIRNPAHPKYNAHDAKKSFGYGRERLCDLLTAFELWDDTICLADSPFFDATNVEAEQVRRLRMLGRACFRNGDLERGCEVLSDCIRMKQKVISDRDAAIAKAKDDKKPTTKAESDAKTRLTRLDETIAELSGYVHLHYKAHDDAKTSFAAAGKMDQSVLADLRFRAGKPDEAIDMLRRDVKSHEGEVLAPGPARGNAGPRRTHRRREERVRRPPHARRRSRHPYSDLSASRRRRERLGREGRLAHAAPGKDRRRTAPAPRFARPLQLVSSSRLPLATSRRRRRRTFPRRWNGTPADHRLLTRCSLSALQRAESEVCRRTKEVRRSRFETRVHQHRCRGRPP